MNENLLNEIKIEMENLIQKYDELDTKKADILTEQKQLKEKINGFKTAIIGIQKGLGIYEKKQINDTAKTHQTQENEDYEPDFN